MKRMEIAIFKFGSLPIGLRLGFHNLMSLTTDKSCDGQSKRPFSIEIIAVRTFNITSF